jgi:glycosyltransferase involved in cell wall biosynthesis
VPGRSLSSRVARWKALAGLTLQRYLPTHRLRRRLFQTPATHNVPGDTRQLLVDVSTIVRHDAQTGIQRVVRAITRELLNQVPAGTDVRPVCATRWTKYRYSHSYAAHLRGTAPGPVDCSRISISPGDVFLALDLTAHVLPRHALQLARWRMAGAKIYFVVHDLLPVQHPEWFTKRAVRNYKAWIRNLAILADGAICTSVTGARELERWLEGNFGRLEPAISIQSFYLGSDIEASAPSAGLPHGFQQALERLQGTFVVLMVGTIEPRKAHEQVLAAFELLWAKGRDFSLVVVGRVGWKSARLAAKLRGHPAIGRRLHWFENASDEALAALYQRADGVLVASLAEGFGLPVVEAAFYGKPVLARDIRIFREIAGANAQFFSADLPSELSQAIADWQEQVCAGSARPNRGPAPHTWREGAQMLLRELKLD